MTHPRVTFLTIIGTVLAPANLLLFPNPPGSHVDVDRENDTKNHNTRAVPAFRSMCHLLGYGDRFISAVHFATIGRRTFDDLDNALARG